MGTEGEKLLEEAGFPLGQARVRGAWLATYVFFLYAAHLRFDADRTVAARVLVIFVPVLASGYVTFRGLLALERLQARSSDAEARLNAAQVVDHPRYRDLKWARWKRSSARGAVRFVLRQAPRFVMLIAPAVIGLVVLLAPQALIPPGTFAPAPRSILFVAGAVCAALLIGGVLAAWDWKHAKRSWAALEPIERQHEHVSAAEPSVAADAEPE